MPSLRKCCGGGSVTRRDVCWYCGGRLIWGNDWNPEDWGLDGEGIVSTLTCSGCGAEVQYVLINEEE